MRSTIYFSALILALGGALPLVGCDVHDNVLNIDDPKVNFDTDVDVENVEQGQAVSVNVDVEDAVLVAPEEEPPSGQADMAVFVQIHMDDTDSAPLVVTAEASATVMIPADTPPGKHELICAVHRHDNGEPTGQESSIEINVKASATVTE